MTSCVENLSEGCYKYSMVVPKQPIDFSEIIQHVNMFQKKLDEKYPWQSTECGNDKCRYSEQIKNPKIGDVEVLKSKERFRLIFDYLIYIKVLQNPVDIIEGVSNLEFVKTSDVCKCNKCNNSFKDTYIYKYANNDFICINCVISYVDKKITKEGLSYILSEILFIHYFVIKNKNTFHSVSLTSSRKITCTECKNTYTNAGNSHYSLQYYDSGKSVYCCLSCAVSYKTEETVQTPQITSDIKIIEKSPPKPSKTELPKRQSRKGSKEIHSTRKNLNRQSSKSSKKRSRNRSKIGYLKTSKKTSRKRSKRGYLKSSKKRSRKRSRK
jgi:hypothetical protein